MFGTRSAEAQLRTWMEREGNWRLKGMLAAAVPESPYTAEQMGRAFESLAGKDDLKRFHLQKRPDGHEMPPSDTIRPLSSHYDGRKEPEYARELSKNDSKLRQHDLEAGVDLDLYMGRALIGETTSEKDVLWREQLLDSVIMGAEEAKVARDASTVIEVDTKKGDHPVRENERFAKKVAEGAGIPFDELDYSANAWNAEKYGLGAYITEELLDHALIDVMEANIRDLGASVENSLNRVFMNELVDNANSSNDVETNAGTSAPYGTDLDDVLSARNNVIASNWPAPDTVVMHNDFQLGVVYGSNDQNLMFNNRAGDQFDAKVDARFPAGLLGLDNAFVVQDGPYNGSNNWGYDTDGHFGAVMYPREFMFTYIYRDLETKDFDDPIRDLEGANVRAQFDAVWGQTDAAARIKN